MVRTLDEILELLGGKQRVAEKLGCGRPAISNWKMNGLPPRRIMELADLAAADEISLSLADIKQANDLITGKGKPSGAEDHPHTQASSP